MNSAHTFSLVAALLVAVEATSLGAQIAGAPQPFEAASVKPNTSGDSRRMIGPGPGGRFTAINVTLRQLVAFAFGVSNSRSDMLVIGGPGWVAQQRFDVDAVATGGSIARGQGGPMVRALLEERFQLRAHKETTDRPVYHLVVDRADRHLGPKLRRSTTDCEARRAARAAGAAPAPAAPSRPPQDPSTIRPRCGLRESPGLFAGDGITTARLAEGLAPFAGRVIFDRTGLQEYFDVDLEWTTDPRGGPDGAAASSVPTDLPGLFTALKEQLGLKLEDARGPVEVVVIDSVTPLIPN